MSTIEPSCVNGPNGQRQAVSGPAGPVPSRRARSIRRTSTIDMTWPDGRGTQLRLEGRARDAVTHTPDTSPQVVDQASLGVGIGTGRQIEDIASSPTRSGTANLIGCRGGGKLRSALDEFLPGERASGSPLYLLLDDLSGTSLIAGFAWSRWDTEWMEPVAGTVRMSMADVCIGFAPGSSALTETGTSKGSQAVQPVGPLVLPDDPLGWHELADLPQVSMRRARYIDVWVDDLIQIDAGFQDSAGDPDHGRVAVHEYRLRATADPLLLTLTSLSPDPRVLPYNECPAAVNNAQQLVGTPLARLRSTVLDRLGRTNGCTHLNDMLRSLAEVPALLAQLQNHAPANGSD